MEAVEKVRKKKRKRQETDISEGSGSSNRDHDIKHRSKRVHHDQSSSDGGNIVLLSRDHHEEMLDTVSGHIRELEIKERHVDGDSPKTSKQTKAGAKAKRTKKKKQTEPSKLDENGGEGTSLGDDVGSSAQMESTTDISSSGVNQESALEYLLLWKEERERWSFKKKTQYWLLRNMYDRTKVGYSTQYNMLCGCNIVIILLQVPKSGFKIMLRYLAGLQGRQRELAVQKAQKIVDQYGEKGQSLTQRPPSSPPPPPPP